jgi:shikimate kinase
LLFWFQEVLNNTLTSSDKLTNWNRSFGEKLPEPSQCFAQGAQKNMSRENIILTGFMATGKTTVGKLLAERLGYEFVDTDQLIVERSGMRVEEIFQVKGEAAFRKMEADLARELGDREGVVVSTGGRLMLNPSNAEALSRRGRVFCLVATPEEIHDRVTQDKDVKRPLLETHDPLQRIVELLQQREKD